MKPIIDRKEEDEIADIIKESIKRADNVMNVYYSHIQNRAEGWDIDKANKEDQIVYGQVLNILLGLHIKKILNKQ